MRQKEGGRRTEVGGVQVLQCPGESVSVCVPFLFFHSVPETVTCLFHRPLLVLKVCLFFSSPSVACFSLHYSITSLLIYLSVFTTIVFVFAGLSSGCT